MLQVVGERNVGTVYDNLGFDCRYSIFIGVDSIFLNVVMSSEYSNIYEYVSKTFLATALTFELGLVLRIKGNKHLQR